VLGEKLRAEGVTTTDKLLQATLTKKQRVDLAAKAGISEKLILRFANMVDLFRITGVGQEFAQLLEAAGVDTVPELAQRRADNLTLKMEELNDARKLTRRTPSLKEVEKWVEEANSLPRSLEY
jgi:predicted flap endonuclease-1-like 5' DNA nuclease